MIFILFRKARTPARSEAGCPALSTVLMCGVIFYPHTCIPAIPASELYDWLATLQILNYHWFKNHEQSVDWIISVQEAGFDGKSEKKRYDVM